jgi:hypothetical protein
MKLIDKLIGRMFMGIVITLALTPLIVALSLIFLPFIFAFGPEGIFIFSILLIFISFFIIIAQSEQYSLSNQEVNDLRKVETVDITSLYSLVETANYPSTDNLVQITGEVICDTPLISEIAEIPCIYYQLYISWWCGSHDEAREGEIHRECLTPRFLLQDGTGTVAVESTGAEINYFIEPQGRKESYVRFQNGKIIATKSGKTLGGYICFFFHLYKSFYEAVIPLNSKIYVIGKIIKGKNKPLAGNNLSLQARYIGVKGKKTLINSILIQGDEAQNIMIIAKWLSIISIFLFLTLNGLALFIYNN